MQNILIFVIFIYYIINDNDKPSHGTGPKARLSGRLTRNIVY